MRHMYRTLMFLFSLSLLSMSSVFANDNFEGEILSNLIDIREEDRYLTYGEYAEVELTAQQAVSLNFNNEVVPYGLELQLVDDSTYVLFGRAEFLGTLCFLVDATKLNSGDLTTERLCLHSEDNQELNYPVILTQRFLDPVKSNEYAAIDIEVFSGDVQVDSEVITDLPMGLSTSISRNGENDILTVNGSLQAEGVYEFIVKSTESQTQVSTYKQFVLEVTPEERTYQCAPGYYYDDYLGYCVQTAGRTCGDGTFYDPQTNSCQAYRTPTNYSCGVGRYFDHWLNRCVWNSGRRCPLNYEWDGFYNRCVRLPYTCSIGQRYSWRLQACVSLYRYRSCRIGTHWNSWRQRCVRNVRACRIGDYWSGDRCVRTVRYCNPGRYFDPYSRRCVPRHTSRFCGPRSVWSHRSRSCVRRHVYANRTCRAGSRWSHRGGRCVRHNPTRVNRHPRRRHRPGPVVRPRPRPNRPTTRPNRPTTRPNRPTTRPNRPTTRPNRPTTRPNRPTTRPNRPTTRPNQPTTRPNRPTTRPNRPTTRPNRPTTRPSQPTTRPSRPSTRPSQPSTRPSRPSRGNNGRRRNG